MTDTKTSLPLQPPLGLFEGQTSIGDIHKMGDCAFDIDSQRYTVTSARNSASETQDVFHYVWKKLKGDFILTFQADFVGDARLASKLGWMVRSSLNATSPHIAACKNGDGQSSLQFRRVQQGLTEEMIAPINNADVIQIERKGNTYIMSVAPFGMPFTTIQVADLVLSDEVYAGLFICGQDLARADQAIFQNVQIVEPAPKVFNYKTGKLASNLEILDIQTGQRQVIYQAPYIFEAPNWTLDGKALIYNSGGQLYHFDLAKREPTLINTSFANRCNNDHVISFDGEQLAISHNRESDGASIVYTVPIEGGEPKQVTDY
ncbi:MAG: biopolymer transporter TolR, partial [Chloroflexota bacterium]